MDVKIDKPYRSLGQYVANLGFEMGVENRAAEMEHVCLHKLNS